MSGNFMINLKHFRRKKGWTLQKLANKCDSSKSYIWELENNPALEPSCKKVSLISSALGISIDHLFTGCGDTEYDHGFLDGVRHTRELIFKTLEQL